MSLYFLVYVFVSASARYPNAFVTNVYPIIVICNTIFILVALFLYTYAICLIKKAINQTSNYNFTNRMTYVMVSLYVTLFVLEVIYFLTWQVQSF